MRLLLTLFILVPILEMAILIKVGGLIGVFPTIALVVLTAVMGVWLLKLEGLATWSRVQQKLVSGEIPGVEMLEGIMLLVGGALLLTPGFFTDTLGFICLIPGFRKPLARKLIQGGLSSFVFRTGGPTTFGSPHGSPFNHPDFEGEFTVIKEDRDAERIEKETGRLHGTRDEER